MSQNFFYCSELSRRVAEKTYGTASIGNVWLLIEYPHAWESKALEESALPSSVKSHFNKVIKTIPRARVLLIKQERKRTDAFNFFLVRCREREPFIIKFNLQDYPQLTEIDIAAVIAGRSLEGGTKTDDPLFLVCTHGKRDKCCAKFGYPLFKSLRAEIGTSVWQSSHVGGDRFAANLICFPHGLFYARAVEDTGRLIADEYTRRRLVLENYRGRACYAHPAQAAEFFIRSETGLTDLDGLRYLDTHALSQDIWRVRFTTPDESAIHEAQVSRTISEFQNFITCHATAEKRVAQFVLDDYRVTVG